MENIFFNKNNLLYHKKNSITEELCKDIIEEFEKDLIINKYLLISNNNETIIDIPNDKSKYPFYYKLKKYLSKEINNHIEIYKNKMNSVLYISKENNYNMNFNVLNTKPINSDLKINIKKTIHTEQNEKTIKVINKINQNIQDSNIKILSFIWFLNDFDCEINFWNDYIFKPSIGTLFIFPVSWCFPYEEISILNKEQYTISGYIYS